MEGVVIVRGRRRRTVGAGHPTSDRYSRGSIGWIASTALDDQIGRAVESRDVGSVYRFDVGVLMARRDWYCEDVLSEKLKRVACDFAEFGSPA